MMRVVALLAAVTLIGAACFAPGAGSLRSVELALASGDACTLNGRIVSFRDLPRALKAAGAGRRTVINVKIPSDVPAEALRSLTSRLASAGYSRVVFARPRRTAARAKKR